MGGDRSLVGLLETVIFGGDNDLVVAQRGVNQVISLLLEGSSEETENMRRHASV